MSHRRKWDSNMPLAEQVSGPYSGYFVGSYVVQAGDGYVAYTKVFRARPDNPWSSPAMLKLSGFSAHSHMAAMARAQSRALDCIKFLPARPAIDVELPDEALSQAA